jgi:hypothetical protein
MSNFYIVPPRLIVGSFDKNNAVTSLNNLRGDLSINADSTNGVNLNITRGILTFSITPNFYIKSAGDTVAGNVVFTPSAGNYGLAVGSGSTYPTTAASGALFYDTSVGKLKIYSGSSWSEITGSGGITTATTDARYWMLDGSNTPTANISLGSSLLRLANLTTRVSAGLSGQIYFNTDTNKIDFYNGATWNSVGTGITSIIVGNGISSSAGSPIVSQSTISVNENANFTWTGSHVYTSAITYAAAQTFDITKLSASGSTSGDIIYYSGSNWARFGIGSTSQVLTVNTSGDGITWAAASATGTTTIGIPADGIYTDGFFTTWTSSTPISNAMDDINELLSQIAPARPGYLTSTALTATSVPTYYTVRLSAGLGTEWYQAGYGTGSLITSKYYLSGTHTLSTANTTTAFSAGSLTTSTYGTLYFYRINSTVPSGGGVGTIDLTTNYAVNYTSNNLKLTALSAYNTIWTKANAQISAYTQPNPGYEGVYIAHTENSQFTNTYEMWKDPWSASNGSPTFSQSATGATYTQTLKYLSGIEYYTTGTGFSVYFKGAAGIYSCAYNATQVYTISATGLATASGTASSPLYSDELDKSGVNHARVTLNSASASSFNKYLTVTIYKAHNTTAASNATISKSINTYSTVSTDTYEGFQDEARRLVIGSGIAFTSTIDMASGNAQVRSGTLQYPLVADYDTQYGGSHTFSGDQEYQRYFYKTSASTGTLTFTGFTASNIASYGTGSVNVLLYLEGDNKYFDLGVLQGSNSNDGSSRAAAISAKTSASSGALNWSLGVYTTGVSGAGNSGRYRAIIILRNNTYNMTSITSS